MRLDPTITSGRIVRAQPRTKKSLIYDATPGPFSNLNPAKCGQGTTPRDGHLWATNMLKQVEQLTYVENTPIG